ncbi:MAG TPA: DUF2207 domain-containing protein [Rhodanobacteraceae bacterium]|nr:DUF2207 domain-containing protein [Rhodanobacteraceae bacterium]
MRPLLPRCLLVFALLLLPALACHADERILDYHADIAIGADGGMAVTEHIKVRAEGRDIRHGIYRDFPTDYRDRYHNRYHVDFEITGAQRDGQAEQWHSERRANGVRVYLGDSTETVAPGIHDYAISYHTTRQLGFFDDHDELYWNVTGTGWVFPIDHASASVHLPRAVDAGLKASGATGAEGEQGRALSAKVTADGADYATLQPLGAHENLSVLLEFPKGLIPPPASGQKAIWLLEDNRNLLLGLLGLIALWLYYGWSWNRVGRDPEAGPRVAEYEPPGGDSAAALRYVRHMGYDQTCFTAGILGIAAKGGLTLTRGSDQSWVATRSEMADASRLSADEKALRDALFADGPTLEFKQASHRRVSAASSALRKALAAGFAGKMFVTNSLKLVPGVLVTLLAAWLIARGGSEGSGFMLLWLAVWSVALGWLALRTLDQAATRQFGPWLMLIIFSVAELGGLVMLGHMVGYAAATVFVTLLITNVLFYRWLKAPTAAGARLLDRIDGFRWYLGVAEKQALDSRYKPEARPELFGAYLPYALALGVGNAWAARFADALTPAQMQQAQPRWYSGGGLDHLDAASFGALSHDLSSSLGGAIASASVAPGSSSGSGGGSGGGGGGGGGGGW